MAAIPLHCEVYKEVQKLEKLRKESDSLIKAINVMHEAIAGPGRMDNRTMDKLRVLYAELAANHEAEALLADACVERLQLLMDTHHKGVKKAADFDRFTPNKLKRSKTADTRMKDPPVWHGEGEAPVLCGRVRWPYDLEIPAGFMVVIKVNKSQPRTWIMGTVMRYHAPKNKYEIEDLDVSETSHHDCIRKTYTLPAKSVIPLPYVVPPHFDEQTEFAIDDQVAALYPQTTSFYPAVVVAVPSETGTGKYGLKFEDDNRTHFINWRFVLHDPDTYYS